MANCTSGTVHGVHTSSPSSYNPTTYSTPVKLSRKPVLDDEKAVPLLWKSVSISWLVTMGARSLADTGARRSNLPESVNAGDPTSGWRRGEMDTTQLGASAPVLFAATAISEGKFCTTMSGI
jgi:hypothetical protein